MLMNSQGQTKLQENQNTINNLMDRVRELHCEINKNMIQRISRTPSRCTVDNFHTFPVNLRYFLTKMSEEICLTALKLCRPTDGIRSVHRETFLEVRLRIHRHPMKGCHHHPDAGRIPERTSTGQSVTEDCDRGKGAIPNPRFLRRSSTGHSFAPMKGRNF